MIRTKDFRSKVKAAGQADGLEEGQFTALVSVFGNTDSVGDVVLPGAFSKSLVGWAGSGDRIPVIWSHDWSNPFSHIGLVIKAEETDAGLVVTGELDTENPTAQQVYRLLKGRRVKQFSFAYDIVDGAPGTKDGRDVFELRELAVHEVGPCLLGANQETQLLAAKAHQLAHAVETDTLRLDPGEWALIRDAYDLLGDALKTFPSNNTTKQTDQNVKDSKDSADSQPDTEAAATAAQSAVLSPAQLATWKQVHELTMKGHI